MIAQAKPGDYMLSLEKWKENRTNLQNAFMHVCFDTYSKELGYSPDEAKFLLKRDYGVNRLFRNKRTGEQELQIRKTSTYNIAEGAVFIDRLLRHFEYDCGIIIDSETRKKYRLDEITGELTQLEKQP